MRFIRIRFFVCSLTMFQLINPSILALAGFIAVPIILHFLFRRKKVRVLFSSIFLLKLLKAEKKDLSNWLDRLVLLCRILTILALVLAFSEPISHHAFALSKSEKSRVFIAVDRSIYLQFSQDGVAIKELLINDLQTYFNQFPLENRFFFLNNQMEVEELKASEIIQAILGETMQEYRDFPIERADFSIEKFAGETDLRLYEKHLFSPIAVTEDPSWNLHYVIESQEPYRNYAVRQLRFSNRRFTESDDIRVICDMDFPDKQAIQLKVQLNNESVFNRRIQKEDFPLNLGKFPNGDYQMTIEADYNDHFKDDNRYYCDFSIGKEKKLLALYSEEKSALNAFFKQFPDSSYVVQRDDISRLLHYQLSAFDIIFIEAAGFEPRIAEMLKTIIENGRSELVFIPRLESNSFQFQTSPLKMHIPMLTLDSTAYYLTKLNWPSLSIGRNNIKLETNGLEVHRHFQYDERGFRRLVYDRIPILLESTRYPLYLFTIPWQESAGNLIYHSRFADLVMNISKENKYALTFDAQRDALQFYSEQAIKETLLAKGFRPFYLRLKSSKENRHHYQAGADYSSGHYRIELNEKQFAFSINRGALTVEKLKVKSMETRAESKSDRHFHWRNLIALACLFYLVELWLGRANKLWKI